MRTTNSAPAVSVLLPFYNAETTLKECMDSIVSQELSDFEVVAINDHSEDGSACLIEEYKDERIRVINNKGKGLVAALNYGLEKCRSKLIARMDADDIMRVQRLLKQKNYLNEHSEICLVASKVRKFPEEKIQNGYKEYIRWQNSCVSSDDINNQIYIESPLAHPSVMFRKDVIVSMGGYREGVFPEDYDLWLRLYQAGHVMDKIPEVLLDWRESDSRLSRTAVQYSRHAFDCLRAEYLAKDSRIQNRPIVYWGAGRKTRLRCRHLINKGYKPMAWIDIDPKKIGNVIDGARVEEPDWLDRDDRPFVLNYVTNHGARDITRTFLDRIGYRIGIDYLEVG